MACTSAVSAASVVSSAFRAKAVAPSVVMVLAAVLPIELPASCRELLESSPGDLMAPPVRPDVAGGGVASTWRRSARVVVLARVAPAPRRWDSGGEPKRSLRAGLVLVSALAGCWAGGAVPCACVCLQ
jgi:hypothetical protein